MQAENIVEKLTTCIQNKTPICYSKYGDGEYICANYGNVPEAGDVNCDNDSYSEKKGQGIIASFKYIVNNLDNAYIGAWENESVTNYWKSLFRDDDESKIKWAYYHTFIIGDEDFGTDQLEKKVALYKAIQDSPLKKIMICNPLLVKAKKLFKVDEMIHVPFNNWFESHYDQLLDNIKLKIEHEDLLMTSQRPSTDISGVPMNFLNDPTFVSEEQPIILTACGMSAKILIADLAKVYPKGIFLDIGSATDFLCTTCDTRGRKYSYPDIFNLFEPILPHDWHDPKYNEIYENSRRYLRRM